jgi:hypothetical protein
MSSRKRTHENPPDTPTVAFRKLYKYQFVRTEKLSAAANACWPFQDAQDDCAVRSAAMNRKGIELLHAYDTGASGHHPQAGEMLRAVLVRQELYENQWPATGALAASSALAAGARLWQCPAACLLSLEY